MIEEVGWDTMIRDHETDLPAGGIHEVRISRVQGRKDIQGKGLEVEEEKSTGAGPHAGMSIALPGIMVSIFQLLYMQSYLLFLCASAYS